jgi:hypothetical protein
MSYLVSKEEALLLLKGWQKSHPPKDGRDFVGLWSDREPHLLFWDKNNETWSGVTKDEYEEPEYWRELNATENKRLEKWTKFLDKWS